MDKLDYFQRDMRYANVLLSAGFERFIDNGRVIGRRSPMSGQLIYQNAGWWVGPQPSNDGAVDGSGEGKGDAMDAMSSQGTAREDVSP